METLEQMVDMTAKLFECDRDEMYSYILRLCSKSLPFLFLSVNGSFIYFWSVCVDVFGLLYTYSLFELS